MGKITKKKTTRGASFNPPNRFEQLHLERIDVGPGPDEDGLLARTVFFNDRSASILARNDSPDVPFTYSVNPYRGCEHGCIYCYARPSHEYLGFSSGVDFDSKILVKHDAPELLSKAFARKAWTPQVVALAGNTDPYQPVERRLQLTRRCLEVFLRYRNPVGIITKNALVTRDLDLLRPLASLNLVSVTISVTTLDARLARRMEPRTSAPKNRLETVGLLSGEGIPVCVLIAPVIPGLTDEEIPRILEEASARGAASAGYTVVRLPGPVEPLFIDWVRRELPERSEKILRRIAEVHGGKLNDSRWGTRMRGEGEMASSVRTLFRVVSKKLKLNSRRIDLSTDHFLRHPGGQLEMF